MTKRSLNKIVEKSKQQRIDERVCNAENYKTDDRVDAHDDHDNWVEHNQFVEADFECGLGCNEMGKFNKDDSDAIHRQSREEACIEDKKI